MVRLKQQRVPVSPGTLFLEQKSNDSANRENIADRRAVGAWRTRAAYCRSVWAL